MFELGKWLVICDRCGFRRKAPDEIIDTWDGFKVCAPHIKGCWEARHPLDFVRGKPDIQSVSYTRPQPAELDQSPAYNCDTFIPLQLTPVDLQVDTIVFKAYATGPISVEAILTVVCSLEIQ